MGSAGEVFLLRKWKTCYIMAYGFTSTDKNRCEEVMKRYQTEPRKDYKMPIIEW